jgi:formate-dependent nitrite reductase membrane component NrfD
MQEITITSGRMNPGVDPVLHAWGWEVPLYLFLGGLVAGILLFSAIYFLRGKGEEYKAAVKIAPLWTPLFLAIGLIALVLDLSHKLYFWQLFTTIRLESPMSWGAWALNLIFPLSILWSAIWVKDVYPNWSWKFKMIEKWVNWLQNYKKQMAWSLVFLSIVLGIYTGILLSAFNARPFWNTAILGPLFLVSGMSTGVAFVMLISKNAAERKRFSQLDLVLIGIELFLIIHLFMGMLAGAEVHIHAASLFLGGSYTAVFWTFVVGFGLVVPMILELMELGGYHIPVKIPALLILFGGLILRFIIVDAGQSSRWLYKFMEQVY